MTSLLFLWMYFNSYKLKLVAIDDYCKLFFIRSMKMSKCSNVAYSSTPNEPSDLPVVMPLDAKI